MTNSVAVQTVNSVTTVRNLESIQVNFGQKCITVAYSECLKDVEGNVLTTKVKTYVLRDVANKPTQQYWTQWQAILSSATSACEILMMEPDIMADLYPKT